MFCENKNESCINKYFQHCFDLLDNTQKPS